MCPDIPEKPTPLPSESTQEMVPDRAIEQQQQAVSEEVATVSESVEQPLTRDQVLEIIGRVPALLIVDDEEALLRSLKRTVGPYVSDRKIIETFNNPEEALKSIINLPDDAVIISDNSMGSYITGIRLARMVQECAGDKNFTFILQSGDVTTQFDLDLASALKNGEIDAFIAKPYLPRDLLAAIAGVLKNKLPPLKEE